MKLTKPRPLSSELLPLQYKTTLSVLELSRVTVSIRKIMREPNFISQVGFLFFDSLMFSLFFFSSSDFITATTCYGRRK